MSKKDFAVLAAAISDVESHDDRKKMALVIGNVCADGNPRFDWVKWNAACKVE